MYRDHGRLCACVFVARCIPTLLPGPGCNLENGWGCPLVVQLRNWLFCVRYDAMWQIRVH